MKEKRSETPGEKISLVKIIHSPEKNIPFMGVVTNADGTKCVDIQNRRTKAHELIPATVFLHLLESYFR